MEGFEQYETKPWEFEYRTAENKVEGFEPVTRELPGGTFVVFPGLCKGCGLCLEKCPKRCLDWSKRLGLYGTPAIEPVDGEACNYCGLCALVCPDCAIMVTKKKRGDA
ncbi:MAG: ferredoxin family protein [Bacillota bacterium]|jgi:2-oxoglutarate ferredoxin oxidoreductase subunit delta